MRVAIFVVAGFSLLVLVAEIYHQYGLSLTSQCGSAVCVANDANEIAIMLRPKHRRYLEAKAKFGLPQNHLEQAITTYQQLQGLRPTWPFYPAQIAGLVLSHNKLATYRPLFDKEWSRWLALGPYEYQLQRAILPLAFSRWYSLDVGQRDDVLRLVIKHCQYRKREAIKSIQQIVKPRVRRLAREACDANS